MDKVYTGHFVGPLVYPLGFVLLWGLLVHLLGSPGSVTEWGAFWVNSSVVVGLCAFSPSSLVPVWWLMLFPPQRSVS